MPFHVWSRWGILIQQFALQTNVPSFSHHIAFLGQKGNQSEIEFALTTHITISAVMRCLDNIASHELNLITV